MGAISPAEKLRIVAPAAGANVGVPHPITETLGGVFTAIPAGSGSVKLTPAMVVEVGLGIVKDRVELLPDVIESGINRLLISILDGPMTLKFL